MRPATGNFRSATSSDCSPGATAFSPRRTSRPVRWARKRHKRGRHTRGRRVSSNQCRPIFLTSRSTGSPAFAGDDGGFVAAQKVTTVHYSATVGMQQPPFILGEFLVMRVAVAIIGLLALGGCAGDVSTIDQPSMYINMANGGAKLDPQAAASMISLYRQNNGL